jgi:hypothetical protein
MTGIIYMYEHVMDAECQGCSGVLIHAFALCAALVTDIEMNLFLSVINHLFICLFDPKAFRPVTGSQHL